MSDIALGGEKCTISKGIVILILHKDIYWKGVKYKEPNAIHNGVWGQVYSRERGRS